MATVTYLTCDSCGGAIPSTADRIESIGGNLILGGQTASFTGLSFCCTAHMEAWLGAQPAVATPSPAYQVPTP